jgi:hypothetical protein
MKLIFPRGLDCSDYTKATEQSLGVVPDIDKQSTDGTKDAIAVAALVLSVPSAILATWDIAERAGLLKRLNGWLQTLRNQPRAGEVGIQMPNGQTRQLTEVTPGELIEAANASFPAIAPDERDWDAFVIHASADRAMARRLWEALMIGGVEAYLDKASLRPGNDWQRRLAGAMARTRIYLVLVSTHWNGGWYNGDEVARAISLVREHADRQIVPVVLPGMPWKAHELPYGLAALMPIVLGDFPEEKHGAEVLRAVQELLGRPA